MTDGASPLHKLRPPAPPSHLYQGARDSLDQAIRLFWSGLLASRYEAQTAPRTPIRVLVSLVVGLPILILRAYCSP